ncbi:hypothetical protein R70006_02348 [Paraburkholderia domus]|jgi:hypothetical protein|nr:hypothetical protein [Paraburkholderia domus]MBK5049100.1 hypothetical protein [Burkholderia sp. R-70006]CAE6736130.1 hypothetical protein R70006_02348 [Paraburkholderia domus]
MKISILMGDAQEDDGHITIALSEIMYAGRLLAWFCIGSVASLATDVVARNTSPVVRARASTTISEYAVGACRFRIASMFGGNFRVRSHSSPSQGIYDLPDTGPIASPVLNGGFSLNCNKAHDKQIGISLGAKLVNGRWLRYDPWGDGPELVPFEKLAHVRTVQLKGRNWIGKGITVDDTTGDEERRGRIFSFCLVHNTQALCGTTPVAWLANPKVNQLWKIRAILESIEFVDAPTLANAGAASNSATLDN